MSLPARLFVASVCLIGFSSSVVAGVLYDVDFNAVTVGEPPAVGLGSIPRSTPTRESIFIRPGARSIATVVGSFGAMTDQPLQIDIANPPDATGLSGRTFTLSLRGANIPSYNFYSVRLDMIVDTVTQNRVAVFIDAPKIHSIAFVPDGNIHALGGDDFSVVGSWTSGQLFTVGLTLDTSHGRWSASLNGDTVLRGTTSNTAVRNFRFGTTTMGTSIPYFDNIRIKGFNIPEPSALTLLGIGIAGLGWSVRRREKSLGAL